VFERAEPRDDAREEDDEQVGRVVVHARVFERRDLVEGRGEAHHALAVHRAFAVHVPLRQCECVFSL
jgi:hypothetical protein